MKPSDKHTYKDIAPEHISGVSSGTFDKNRKGKRVNDDLFFVLGMNFLTSNIKAKHYDHESVSDFCKQLVQLFTGEGIPNLAEQWTNNSNVLNYEYEDIIDEESKSHISRLIGDCIVKHPSFSHSRDYYVLGNGLQNLDKVHRVKDLFGKQEAQHYVQNVYAVSLVNIEQSGKTTLAGDVIPDDLNIVAETARIKAEENSLRESFGQETMDDYFARLAFYQHDLRAHYDMEIKNTSPRPWRLAILASIIAYETNNKKEFFQMMMRKIGHINEIAESIRKGYPSQTQKDLYQSFENIRDVTWFTFNYRLIENLQKTFYRKDTLTNTSTIKNRVIKKYKDRFFEALEAANNFSLDKVGIERIVDIEEDKDWFNMYSSEKIDKLINFEDWVMIEASKHNPDYLLIKEPSKLLDQDIFTYSNEQLLESIPAMPDGLLKCCAIWSYIFESRTLLDFSQRFERFSQMLEDDYYFGGELEAKLTLVYDGLPFTDLYSTAIAKAMIESAKNKIESIHELIVNTEEMHSHLKDSYSAEYDFVLKLLQIIEHPTSQEKEIGSLVDLHEKLVLGYSKNESDEDGDDSGDDDMSY